MTKIATFATPGVLPLTGHVCKMETKKLSDVMDECVLRIAYCEFRDAYCVSHNLQTRASKGVLKHKSPAWNTVFETSEGLSVMISPNR
jgi:hypothetical protein